MKIQTVDKQTLKLWVAIALQCRTGKGSTFATRMRETTRREIIKAIRYQRNNRPMEGFHSLIARILNRGCDAINADDLFQKPRPAASSPKR